MSRRVPQPPLSKTVSKISTTAKSTTPTSTNVSTSTSSNSKSNRLSVVWILLIVFAVLLILGGIYYKLNY